MTIFYLASPPKYAKHPLKKSKQEEHCLYPGFNKEKKKKGRGEGGKWEEKGKGEKSKGRQTRTFQVQKINTSLKAIIAKLKHNQYM